MYQIALWNEARVFFWAAEMLPKDNFSRSKPVYFLYCHSIELALKAKLFYSGINERELRKIGHDLQFALKKANLENLTDLERAKYTIELINPYYQAKELEYSVSGLRTLPAFSDMSITAKDVILSVGKAIKIPFAQLKLL